MFITNVKRQAYTSQGHSECRRTLHPQYFLRFSLFQRGDRLYASESDVCRRQILTTKEDPCAERIKILLMVGDPEHRYSNESERTN